MRKERGEGGRGFCFVLGKSIFVLTFFFFFPLFFFFFRNSFNWWIGLFYGVLPSSFACGHSINHHKYNNGPLDVVSTSDKVPFLFPFPFPFPFPFHPLFLSPPPKKKTLLFSNPFPPPSPPTTPTAS